MPKIPLLIAVLALLIRPSPTVAESSAEKYRSAEQLRELEIDELIKSLEARINAKELSSREVYETIGEAPRPEEQPSSKANVLQEQQAAGGSFHAPPNPRDRAAALRGEAKQIAEEQSADRDASARMSKRKIYDDHDDIDELAKESYALRPERNFQDVNHLSEFEKDENYYRTLLRLQNLYRLYNQRFLDDEPDRAEERSPRTFGSHAMDLNRRIDLIQSKKMRYLERSRSVADRIAESAMHLARKKSRLMDHVLHPGGSSRASGAGYGCPGRSHTVLVGQPVAVQQMPPLVIMEAATKRDTEVAAQAAAATKVDASVGSSAGGGGAHVDAATSAAVAGSAKVASGPGGSGASVSTAAKVNSDLHVDSSAGGLSSGVSAGLSAGASSHLSVGANSGSGLASMLGSVDNYERKMIMDLAIEEAAGMIRRLAYETRSEVVCREDPEFDRRILGLAIDLVNKVTEGVTGDVNGKFDLLAGMRYHNVDDYLKASIFDSEIEADLISNAGFDYANQGLGRNHGLLDGRGLYDGLDATDDYLGHPSPYSRGHCDSFDPRTSGLCPLCKRSERVFSGRRKRRPERRSRILHLEQAEAAQPKKRKSGGVWEDVNKLYNFNDIENDKFIDLSLNCSSVNETNPDCERLKLNLVTPRDSEPVPLWFVRDYLSQGRDLAVDMHERARGLQSPAPHSASQLHFLNHKLSEDSVVQLNQESQIMLFGAKVLQEKLYTEYNITPSTFLEFLEHHGFRVTGSRICRGRRRRCNGSAKFRSLEGSCNNFRNPTWGQSNTAFNRVLPARYSDAEGGIECCGTRGSGPLPKTLQHHSCAPIDIEEADSFYKRYGQTCMNFVRSMTVASEDCSLGPANQLNGVSSFLDLSPVYGVDRATSDALREFRGGRMRVEIRGDRVTMPTSARSGFCDAHTARDICFETGDVRTNQNPQLIVLQTLLIREHNRVAYELAALNPHWDDERLFQESRNIVIAEYQHITYRHWLPLVLGKKYSRDYSIVPSSDELSNDYDVRINPSTINSFTSAAFRFLHSTIAGNINLFTDDYVASDTIRLSDHYFRPQIVEPNNNFESLLRGLVHQTIQKPGANFHEEVTEYLFRSGHDYGMDLEAIDIQRGRDHGIPGYNAFRETCRLGRAEDFLGLINEISLASIEKLQRVYRHVEDIDLFVGAAMETRLPGSLLGPTLQCLIGEQFYRSRVGDKYFYNNANFPHSFTPEQFEEIKKANLATIICDLGEAVYEVQRNPFKVNSYKNPMAPCFNLPKINLEYWKEEVGYYYSY